VPGFAERGSSVVGAASPEGRLEGSAALQSLGPEDDAHLMGIPQAAVGNDQLSHRLLRHVLLAVVLLAALLVAIVGHTSASAEAVRTPVQVSADSSGGSGPHGSGSAVGLR
jgi:hypothetical protein